MLQIPDLETINRHFLSLIGNPTNADIRLYVFPQDWPNTGGGCAMPGCCYGQAFVTEYTTVIFSRRYNLATVWFNNQYGYSIHGLTNRFWDDLFERDMKNKGHASYYSI